MQKGFITAKTEIKNKFTSFKDVDDTKDTLTADIPDLGNADLRPLAERLRESEKIKEEEFAQQVRLANTLRGVDQDELDFLDVEQKKKKLKDKSVKEEIDKQVEEFIQRQNSVKTVLNKSEKMSVAGLVKSQVRKETKVPIVMIKRKNSNLDSRAQKKIVEYSDSD